jgi:hypothetical protein
MTDELKFKIADRAGLYFTCSVCAAIVFDISLHYEWHLKFNPVLKLKEKLEEDKSKSNDETG